MAYDVAALENLIEQFRKIPSIGRKTAQRMAFHVLDLSDDEAKAFADAIIEAHSKIHQCSVCHNITENELCPVCLSTNRDHSLVCVMEEPRDVLALERMREFNGVYHVLGGVISPMDGVSPGDLQIDSLVKRVAEEDVKEVILALSPTMEGDTTNFYIFRKLADSNAKLSVIARGISVGDELEYTDEVTLGRSIVNRTPFTGKVY